MRVLYGIQCTGNGHITRSIDLIKELRKYVQVDVLTSGSHSEVKLPFEVKYCRKGLAYYFGKNGSFDLGRTLRENNLMRFYKELRTVPTHLYDMVISDFEPITAWSAKRDWIYSVGVSNQVALLHPQVPKPNVVSPFSKLIINKFCPTKKNYGLYYSKLNEELYYPPIRDMVKGLKPEVQDYYVVYLPSYGNDKLIKHLSTFSDTHWVIFSKHAEKTSYHGNITINPIADYAFLKAIEKCKGVLCGAGFGTTSEALYLKKKLMVIPMKSQYEQQCNAHSLQLLGVSVIQKLSKKNYSSIHAWLNNGTIPQVEILDEKNKLVRTILNDYVQYVNSTEIY
ncbi:MAG: hypothetical protein ACI9AU_001358 [Bacteroidia bacterium]|jgi:uncharacterized protein (TIGR00661 family)